MEVWKVQYQITPGQPVTSLSTKIRPVQVFQDNTFVAKGEWEGGAYEQVGLAYNNDTEHVIQVAHADTWEVKWLSASTDLVRQVEAIQNSPLVSIIFPSGRVVTGIKAFDFSASRQSEITSIFEVSIKLKKITNLDCWFDYDVHTEFSDFAQIIYSDQTFQTHLVARKSIETEQLEASDYDKTIVPAHKEKTIYTLRMYLTDADTADLKERAELTGVNQSDGGSELSATFNETSTGTSSEIIEPIELEVSESGALGINQVTARLCTEANIIPHYG